MLANKISTDELIDSCILKQQWSTLVLKTLHTITNISYWFDPSCKSKYIAIYLAIRDGLTPVLISVSTDTKLIYGLLIGN